MKSEVFLDTSYALALASPGDDFHFRAVMLAEQMATAKTRYVTTYAVMLEIGDALSKSRWRQTAVTLLAALEADSKVKILPISKQLYLDAYQLYNERPDKEWGLTDCASFIVMRDRGLTEALTADVHFRQAGFQILLRDN